LSISSRLETTLQGEVTNGDGIYTDDAAKNLSRWRITQLYADMDGLPREEQTEYIGTIIIDNILGRCANMTNITQ